MTAQEKWNKIESEFTELIADQDSEELNAKWLEWMDARHEANKEALKGMEDLLNSMTTHRKK